MDRLTDSQQKVYDFLRKVAPGGVPPTVREICAATGLRSTSTVHAHLKTLERLGYISRGAGQNRSIRIEGAAAAAQVPILGKVTAGQPILAVLNGAGLENVCCTVTRYFGGVLLGTGGLVRSYTAAAKAALDDAGILRMALWQCVSLRCAYGQFERVRRLLETWEAVVEDTDFGAEVTFSALIRADRAAAFADALRETSAGAIVPEFDGERFCGAKI